MIDSLKRAKVSGKMKRYLWIGKIWNPQQWREKMQFCKINTIIIWIRAPIVIKT